MIGLCGENTNGSEWIRIWLDEVGFIGIKENSWRLLSVFTVRFYARYFLFDFILILWW